MTGAITHQLERLVRAPLYLLLTLYRSRPMRTQEEASILEVLATAARLKNGVPLWWAPARPPSIGSMGHGTRRPVSQRSYLRSSFRTRPENRSRMYRSPVSSSRTMRVGLVSVFTNTSGAEVGVA